MYSNRVCCFNVLYHLPDAPASFKPINPSIKKIIIILLFVYCNSYNINFRVRSNPKGWNISIIL